jgi:hypothetical protein
MPDIDLDQTSLARHNRRFPGWPWSVGETDACFIVHNRGGQKLVYVLL